MIYVNFTIIKKQKELGFILTAVRRCSRAAGVTLAVTGKQSSTDSFDLVVCLGSSVSSCMRRSKDGGEWGDQAKWRMLTSERGKSQAAGLYTISEFS